MYFVIFLNGSPEINFDEILGKNLKSVIEENAFENVVCKITAIVSRTYNSLYFALQVKSG